MNEQLRFGEKVFIDTNFFIALLVRQHQHNASATKLMRLLEENDCELYTSSFVFYELFKKICEFHNDNNGNKLFLRRVNKIIRKVKLKIVDVGFKNATYGDIVSELNQVKESIVGYERMSILPLENVHVQGCVDNINNYNSKPGDSFLASTMQEMEITHIATFDNGFNRFGFVLLQ